MLISLFKLSRQLYENDPCVVILKDETFVEILNKSEKLWIVQFYRSGFDDEEYSPLFSKLAARLQKDFSFGVMDCTEQNNICSQYMYAYIPKIRFFIHGDLVPDESQFYRNIEGIVKSARNHGTSTETPQPNNCGSMTSWIFSLIIFNFYLLFKHQFQ